VPITALLDTCIDPSTVTHDLTVHHESIRLKNRIVSRMLEVPVRRRLRNQTWERSEATYASLAQMAELARLGEVILYDSDETFFEGLYVRLPRLRGTEHDIFRGVERRFVRGPMRRTYVIDGSYDREKEHQRWLQLLAEIAHPRFLKLKKRCGGSHLADLYHVWTAEENSLDCFVTVDERFINAVTLPQPIDTPVKICTPSQFVKFC
jgi:hypothetical protein